MSQLCHRLKVNYMPVARIPFASMGVERENQDMFAPKFEPCSSAAHVHVQRERKMK